MSELLFFVAFFCAFYCVLRRETYRGKELSECVLDHSAMNRRLLFPDSKYTAGVSSPRLCLGENNALWLSYSDRLALFTQGRWRREGRMGRSGWVSGLKLVVGHGGTIQTNEEERRETEETGMTSQCHVGTLCAAAQTAHSEKGCAIERWILVSQATQQLNYNSDQQP